MVPKFVAILIRESCGLVLYCVITIALSSLAPAINWERIRLKSETERRKSVNLARAVRISGDGGQEGRHLAKNGPWARWAPRATST